MAYATTVAGSKLRAKLGASLNEHVSAPTSDFAQQQLLKMGWSEGDGLGKRRQGMNSHITVKRRVENVGVGHSSLPTHSQQWWKDSMGDTLAKLGGKKKTKKRDFTDEDLFEATGGARFGMRAQRKAKAKWARTESQTEEEEREAQSRCEWNGRGAAEVKLSQMDKEKKAGKKRTRTYEESSTFNSVSDTSESKKKKKKRKKDKEDVSDVLVVSDSVNETSGAESRKKKEKRKKDSCDASNLSDSVNDVLGTESKKEKKKRKKDN
jgi:Pin2-interacting protein X1